MPDYGRELQFGAFIPPVAAQTGDVLELSRLADVVGLDLITFQDHPYQPSFLDTWTLLAVVAAQTSSVRVAPNVANLPLRPPVVLARSVATLDVLSGGRVELGLGAGAFWDSIAALGGPSLSPGESVDALEEAIDVIRAVWAADKREVEGRYYRIVGGRVGWSRRTTSRSGSARTSRACSRSPAGRPTAGCRAWATPRRTTCRRCRRVSTRPRSPRAGVRPRYAASTTSTSAAAGCRAPPANARSSSPPWRSATGSTRSSSPSARPTTCAASPRRWRLPPASSSRQNAGVRSAQPRRPRVWKLRPPRPSPCSPPPMRARGSAPSASGTRARARPRSATTPASTRPTSRPRAATWSTSTTACAPSSSGFTTYWSRSAVARRTLGRSAPCSTG